MREGSRGREEIRRSRRADKNMDVSIPLLHRDPRWVPPDGLDRSRPRLVKLTLAGWAIFFLSALLVAGGIGIGTVLSIKAVREASDAKTLQNEGVNVTGRVVNAWRARKEPDQRWISYTFVVDDRTFQKQARIPLRRWNQLRPGSPVVIRYAHNRPELNHPEGIEPERVPAWLPIPLTLLFSLCGVLVRLPLHSQKRFLEEGRSAQAVVTRYGKIYRSHGRERGTQYYYEFLVLSGAVATGKAMAKTPPVIGDRIVVLYDPEEPRKNVPYPLPLYRLAR